jgi:hypothetical protein
MIEEDMELTNLTNHDAIFSIGHQSSFIEPSGKIARVFFEQEYIRDINGIPIYRNVNGWIKGLPKPRPGKGYIVSGIVFQNVLRPDVFCPNTQPWSTTHKEHGRPAHVKSLLGVSL